MRSAAAGGVPPVPSSYRDRVHAGEVLASRCAHLKSARPLVLALPRGGVPVGAVVAESLGAPMDCLVVRKVGAPGHEEFGIGSVAPGGIQIIDQRSAAYVGAPPAEIERIARKERAEMERRQQQYRGTTEPLDLRGRTVLLVDDGIATGVSSRAAIEAARRMGAQRIVFAAPVGSPDIVARLRQTSGVSEVIAPLQPSSLRAIGLWYRDFSQTEDAEVVRLMAQAHDRMASQGLERMEQQQVSGQVESSVLPFDPSTFKVRLPSGELQCRLELPHPTQNHTARGVVVFVHGSGSGMESPRNRSIADILRKDDLATLLIDLLTAEESRVDEVTRQHRFDIALISSRVVAAVDALLDVPQLKSLPVFLLGSSTGAAAALVAAAARPQSVAAVVSRGGRPDLAGDALPRVRAPTLLIVGSRDTEVLQLNAQAKKRMTGASSRLEVVDGATHLFPEPGTLENAAQLTAAFIAHQMQHYDSHSRGQQQATASPQQHAAAAFTDSCHRSTSATSKQQQQQQQQAGLREAPEFKEAAEAKGPEMAAK